MKKTLLLSIPLLCMSFSGLSQVELRLSDAMLLYGGDVPAAEKISERRSAPRDGHGKVEMIIRYSGEASLRDIQARGGEIVSLIGKRTAIVRVDPSQAQTVAYASGVTGAKVSTLMQKTNLMARQASRVDKVHAGTLLPKGFDGSGVVIGLFDTGVDPNHINFFDSEGNRRVKRLWHYDGMTAIPDVYETDARISTFETDANESHGTHVLGIMGGSFADPADPSHDYRGMAPGAEIAIACGDGYNVQILDGIERIAKYAQEQGKRCVINLSFGDNLGPHDGTDEFTEGINDVADKYNAVICMAGGNERQQDISIIKQLPEDKPEVKTLLVKGVTEVDATFQTFGPVEIWTEDDTPFDVSLEIISKTKPEEPQYTLEIPEKKALYVSQGEMINDYIKPINRVDLVTEGTAFHDIYSNSFMGGVKGVDPYNHRYNAQLNFYLQGRTASLIGRNFVRLHVTGQPGKKIFIYCNGTYMNFGHKNIPGIDRCDGNGTNSNIATGYNTIAVGSYVSANVPGSAYPDGKIGELSYFSSFGETPDGRQMPQICAPGQTILSSRNTYLSTGANALAVYPIHYEYKEPKTKETYYWTSCAGTSQSSPHVAGIAALWLQANPDLSYEEVRDIAVATAAAPATAEPGWGAGMIDAYAGLKKALGSSAVENIVAAGEDAVFIETSLNGFDIYAPGCDRFSARLFDLSGSAVREISVMGDKALMSKTGLPGGVYLLCVETPHSRKAEKVMIR